ncbi:hypothetical protein ATANTOWER_007992 [Ataeniobius toweri]|uniref:Uncharacterized protein n=1 Tax=Ataeniobius toweri TaxID=208326 RepID=A0ABU7CFD7_9TELE|nr:hypothetical protein [Ataeniobius toweri]
MSTAWEQVLNVSVIEGEQITVEDTGGQEPFLLANESVLLRGLVLRSWSNQISIHFRSNQRLNSGFLLHYQAKDISSQLEVLQDSHNMLVEYKITRIKKAAIRY